ncbi:hypothetical protein QBC36DRAFT_95687 [Triangularia setosa]|uniref:Uncharacterized protein n=1 Tax=Triangularia setosa TaxID=2587417 RepID=A0AAN6WBF3_9PEZI|nr:hypothetical protein QBC36DRAFT_95687 [Podospora setosa]
MMAMEICFACCCFDIISFFFFFWVGRSLKKKTNDTHDTFLFNMCRNCIIPILCTSFQLFLAPGIYI